MKNKIFLRIVSAAFFLAGLASYLYADQTIIAQKVAQAPIIDGSGNDPVWEKAKAITTYDKVGNIDINLKAVYTDKEIFFLVSFPDPDESRKHKDWVWNKDLEIYEIGPEREDTFELMWNMEKDPVDLSVYSDQPHTLDVWFWKACRTDSNGFSDDKMDILGNDQKRNANKLTSKSGKTMYLQRLGDQGEEAFEEIIPADYAGDRLRNFVSRVPSGSRADIRAKGIWSDGRWTIEFARALVTGYLDDIQLAPGKNYQFGVSRYEVAGKKIDPATEQPLYGAGDVSESLILEFKE